MHRHQLGSGPIARKVKLTLARGENRFNQWTVWTEFSFAWYGRILANPSIQTAALNSIIVATIATVCATAIALLAALATYRPFYGQKMVEGGINLPLILPEIVTAVATLLLFMALGIKLG